MAGRSRYSVSVNGAGMVGGILKNTLGIKRQKELDDAETLLLADAYRYFFDRLEKERFTFDLSFLLQIHQYFLGTLYTWAGSLRQVNIAKGEVMFASAEYLESSMKVFSDGLRRNIPTIKDSKKQVAKKLAFVHNEFNALHPFREGNGRTIRLFLDLMAAQAGYKPIDWGQANNERYIQACKFGLVGKHQAMERIVSSGLLKNNKQDGGVSVSC